MGHILCELNVYLIVDIDDLEHLYGEQLRLLVVTLIRHVILSVQFLPNGISG